MSVDKSTYAHRVGTQIYATRKKQKTVKLGRCGDGASETWRRQPPTQRVWENGHRPREGQKRHCRRGVFAGPDLSLLSVSLRE